MKHILKMIYQSKIKINRLTAIGLFGFILFPVSGQLYDDVTLNEELTKDMVINATGTVTLDNGFYSGNHNLAVETGPHYYKRAQLTSSKSYVHSIQPRVELSETDMNNLFDASASNDPVLYVRDMSEQVTYTDGLGRVKQNIGIMNGVNGEDIVSFGNYQEYSSEQTAYSLLVATGSSGFKGKIQETYLPYGTIKTDGEANWLPGAYHDDPVTDQKSFFEQLYDVWDADYASSQSFIASGTGALKEQAGPGYDWRITDKTGESDGHTRKSKSKLNTTVLNYWHLDGKNQTTYQQMLTGFTLKTGTEAYSTGTIAISEVKDENWYNGELGGIIRTYTDHTGKTIKKEALKNDGTVLTTHYVYDDLGLLRCIVPPAASSPTETDYCYYFAYNSKKQLVEKKVPGAGAVKYCYDNRGRLVAVQDANQQAENKWHITKYDYLNRPVLSAVYTTTKTQTELQTEINGYTGTNLYEDRGTTILGYTCRSFPNTLTSYNSYLTATYYDDYTFPDAISYDASNVDFLTSADKSTKTKGMVTGSKTKILDQGTGMPEWLTSVVYYDKYGRAIQTVGSNHMNGTDRVSNHLNYSGELLESYTQHTTASHATSLTNEFTYDHRGRVMEEYYQVNTEDKIKVKEYEYNELGQVETVYTHMENGETKVDALQTTDFQYNIKGWLTAVNDPDNLGNDVFGMKLAYNDHSGMSNALPGNEKKAYFNGNISVMEWKSKTNSGQQPLAAYAYKYNKLNYLTGASYGDANNWTSWGYDLRNVVYDNNGNIVSFERYNSNGSEMDELALTYSGNQLSTVFENGDRTKGFITNGNTTPYAYDGNGNMTHDHYKGISIAYNELNLPNHVSYGNDDAYFYYDAAGIKLQIFVDEATDATVDYVGSFVYENNQLAYIATSFGRILKVSGGFDYEYFTTDHLGNIRAVYGENSSGNLEVRQLADYYPFGERHDRIYTGITGSDNNYLFNGKEHQSYVGGNFNFYDFGSRYYDPVLGRWHSVDPVMQYASPYIGIGNNPINMIDPNGELAWFVPVIIGAVIGGYLGGSAAEGWELNPTKWKWDSNTWKGIGAGALVGAAAGLGFYYAAPALANTAFFSYFGTSGTISAYTITGAAAGGITGYGAGYSGGYVYSNGNANYAHESGMTGFKIGFTAGAALGGLAGTIESIEKPEPVEDFNPEPVDYEQETPTLESGRANTLSTDRAFDDGPVVINQINVDQTTQTMTYNWQRSGAYEYTAGPFRVSTGKQSTPTYNGDFTVHWRSDNGPLKTLNTHPECHWAVKFDGNRATHTSPLVPPFPASGGCIRVADEAVAKRIWTSSIVGYTKFHIFGKWPGF